MAVEFCPDCGNLLRKSRDESGKTILKCACGFMKPFDAPKKKRKITEHEKKKLMKKTLILEDTNKQTYPTTNVECPECGHMTAEYFQQQTRSADEPATTFYRCLKCNNRWREY